jgi:O-antigen ligase
MTVSRITSWIDKATEYLFYGFFASLIFSNTLAQGVAIIIILFWIIRWIYTRQFIHHPLDYAVIVYLFVRSATCFLSVDPLASMHELRSGVFFSLIYFAITQQVRADSREKLVYRFVAILVYAGAIGALYGIGYTVVQRFTVRAQSTAGGITRFSEYTMIAFCLAFSLFQERRIFPRKYLSYIVIGILGLGLMFAQARAQWIAVVPVILAIGLLRARWMLAGICGFFALVVCTLSPLRRRFTSLLHPTAAMDSRFLIWKGAGEIFFKRPFRGFGPRTYGIVSPYLKNRGTWHSDYLQTYIDSGIFGILSYLYLSFMLFRYSLVLVRLPARRRIGQAFLLTFIAMYIVSFVGGHIQEPVITPLFFSLIAFVSVLSAAGPGPTIPGR